MTNHYTQLAESMTHCLKGIAQTAFNKVDVNNHNFVLQIIMAQYNNTRRKQSSPSTQSFLFATLGQNSEVLI